MKFIVNSTALLKELQKLNGVISSNNTLPILDNFLFEMSSNKMSIVASDLETTMISSISVESDTDGKFTIQARILIDTLKTRGTIVAYNGGFEKGIISKLSQQFPQFSIGKDLIFNWR